MICIFINSYSKVSNGTWFDVCCDECNATKIFGKDAKEVAKLYGMFLRHSGRLKNYAEKDRPGKIFVRWPMGEAHFHHGIRSKHCKEMYKELLLLLSVVLSKRYVFHYSIFDYKMYVVLLISSFINNSSMMKND